MHLIKVNDDECLVATDVIPGPWQHDDVIQGKLFARHRPFLRAIYRSPLNSPHKSKWRGALVFSLIWAWTNGWVNNRDAGYLRRHRTHYYVTAMKTYNVMVNQTRGNVCYITPRAFRIKWQIPPVPLNKSVRYISYSEVQCSWSTHRACIVIISKSMHIHKSNLCDLHSN